MVLWFLNICTALDETAGVKVMESGKALTVNAVVIFAVFGVVAYLMSEIGAWSIGELAINEVTLNELIEQAGGILEMLGNF